MALISSTGNISAIKMDEQGDAPSTPGSADWKLYFKADGMYYIDDEGTETGPLSASGTASTQYMTFTFGYSGTIAAGTQPVRVHAPVACTITNVTATVNTPPAGTSIIVDVNKGGTTIFTTQGNRPTIAAAANDDLSSTPDVTSLAQNDLLTFDIDLVGSSTAGADLVVQVRCTVP